MTEQQEKFLDALFGEAKGDLKKAKEIAGYSASYSIPSIVEPLKEAIADRTRMYIAMNGPKALAGLIDILDKPDKMGNQLRLAAIKDILDRAGFAKTDKVEVKTNTPLFILPSKNEDEDVETS